MARCGSMLSRNLARRLPSRPTETSAGRGERDCQEGKAGLPALGDKFAMLTYLQNIGYECETRRWLCLFRCDCGNEKAMNLYEVRVGRHRSCGCLRDSDERKAAHAAKMSVWIANNKPAINEANAKRGAQSRGKANPIGPSAAWSLNSRANYFALISPDGERISGWNMQQIVRDNRHLFDAIDLEMSGHNFKAVKRLYALFSNGKKAPMKSWKGWRCDASNQHSDLTPVGAAG